MRQTKIIRLVPAVLLAIVLSSCVWAQTSQSFGIKWYSINSGGGMATSASFGVSGTLGQSTIGRATSAGFGVSLGFWHPGIETQPVTEIAGLDEAKLLADGVRVHITAKTATTSASDFGTFIYIQEPDRSSGIRVVATTIVGTLDRGKTVEVTGTMGTNASGERQIVDATVTVTGSPAVVDPLGMTNKSLGGDNLGDPGSGLGQYGVAGGVGTNNVGLLVNVWGKVIDDSNPTSYVIIDDGSGTPVKVDTSRLTANYPSMNNYYSTTGASSLELSGGNRVRVVLMRDDNDCKAQ